MAGHAYMPKRYSNYDDFPAQEGGYAYGPEQHVNWYVVESTVERVRVPASRYTTLGGAPIKHDFHGGNVPKYAPKDRREDFEPLYVTDYENSSPPRYHEGENLVANFRNKLQIGSRPPAKTSNFSGPNKYLPTSPNKYRPKSPPSHQPISPNKYRSSSPNKHRPSSPNKYRPSSPNKYRPSSPNNYRPSSPNKYRTTGPEKYQPSKPYNYRSSSPNKYQPSSPNKYRPSSPIKYETSSPNKYRPTSPDRYHPTNPNKYRPTSPNKYRRSSSDKYQPTSPSKYNPTSLMHDYPSKEAHVTKAQILPGPTKYRPTSPTKYKPTSPTHNYPLKEDRMNSAQDLSDLNNYKATGPVHRALSKEGQPIMAQNLSGPDKNHSSPNYHWQSAGPPNTRHTLTTPTNNINEALGFLMEAVNYSPRSNPRRDEAFDNLSPRAQPIEHERRYARSAFGGKPDRPYLRSNTIDSEEAVRRYNGAYVP